MCIKAVFESINSIRHNDIVTKAMLHVYDMIRAYWKNSSAVRIYIHKDERQTACYPVFGVCFFNMMLLITKASDRGGEGRTEEAWAPYFLVRGQYCWCLPSFQALYVAHFNWPRKIIIVKWWMKSMQRLKSADCSHSQKKQDIGVCMIDFSFPAIIIGTSLIAWYL